MKEKKLTYKDAGVDIQAGDDFVDRISPMVHSTFGPEVLTGIGGFGGLFALDISRMKEPVLVSGTDGVGTKLRLAFLTGMHHTVGIDLVAMCVNDILVSGARPLFFLDYFATGRLNIEQSSDVVKGIVEGCRQAGCALIGGETAEMPGFYRAGEYDLAGFAVGVVERSRLIDGSRMVPGDSVIGIASSGLHSNGYSLVREVFLNVHHTDLEKTIPALGRPLGEILLEPTRIYVRSVLSLLEEKTVKGMAHITGGGIPGNLPRIFPEGCSARIRKGSWDVPAVFSVLSEYGGVPEDEMFRTFNMGIGMALVVSSGDTGEVLKRLRRSGETAWIIGEICEGNREVILQ
ncbi:MAG: phosphoribosylformylglycinamidine cyclo-ligase [Nitrospirae bacterium CG_4_9_14_3_um_filter_53_35]|nr:MAG: phosphoribosylformylglycinamidine cyclo-ligase [Nitrospirae bacterium CG2_30_53_67]PIS37964.1 MAG: phosphoribosylformylglycinamidine cyclo-ligase [Nitrospirae bacterium CG08_land_8_20_14_0_20_52_24]PIV85602.1 MAG: phosphoribosylformylglycinamidine cyclo-ligase [Nitrospirae bacterium CG17_big_fil_post_rev_8_21_14_2_50_50_9]PIW85026.1 MAG: phosphoribosylformylglycinamidine cyclo-ligase [Nitrospirae bacterium CG_4_8_14_3_um_filter_50_41]PIX84490.1 MAG: phosphoribosylformylglycinamidine cyc